MSLGLGVIGCGSVFSGPYRAMIERLSGLGLDAEEAYALLSVAGDLRIHEIVNAPQWVVGMALPQAVLAS